MPVFWYDTMKIKDLTTRVKERRANRGAKALSGELLFMGSQKNARWTGSIEIDFAFCVSSKEKFLNIFICNWNCKSSLASKKDTNFTLLVVLNSKCTYLKHVIHFSSSGLGEIEAFLSTKNISNGYNLILSSVNSVCSILELDQAL